MGAVAAGRPPAGRLRKHHESGRTISSEQQHPASGGQPASVDAPPRPAPIGWRAARNRQRGGAGHGRRGLRIALVVLGLVFFVAVSGWLARFFTTENSERDQILTLLQAEASGDAHRMLAQLGVCNREAACVATVQRDAAGERGTGSLRILALSSPTAYAIQPTEGETRVAWKQGSRLPVVQCVLVHRHGGVLTGMKVDLERISAPIGNTRDCPPAR